MESSAHRKPPTLDETSARVRNICRSGGLPEPDVVVDCHDGEHVALWFDERLAVIVETGGLATAAPDGDADPRGT